MSAIKPSVEISVPDQPEKLDRFMGPLLTLFCIPAILFVSVQGSSGDFFQFLSSINSLADGQWDNIYPIGVEATSMTGWLLFTIGPYLFFDTTLTTAEAFAASGVVILPLFFFGFRFAFWSFWPQRSSVEAWAISVVALMIPSTLSAWVEHFHPQDAAATGVMLFAAGLAARNKWGWSGLLFGVAIMTRQWALLPAIPIAALAGRNAWKFIVGGAISSLALLLPIVVTGNEGWFNVLTFRPGTPGPNSVIGAISTHFMMQENSSVSEVIIDVSRILPVLFAILLGAFIFWKGTFRKIVWPIETILILCIVGVGLRNMFELFSFAYYWAPIAPLFLLLTPGRKWNWIFVAIIGFVPSLLSRIFPWEDAALGTLPTTIATVCYALFSLIVIIAPWYSLKPLRQTAEEKEVLLQKKLLEERAPVWSWVLVGVAFFSVFGLIWLGLIPLGSVPG